MKDFKFTKEERDSIEDFALDQVIERNFGGIENVTDYIESLIQARADEDDTPQMTRAQRKAMANWIMRSVPSIPMSQLDMAVDSMWNTIYPPKQ